MTPVDSLLRACSWRAEKIYRARGRFDCVLWIAEYSDGRRETWETQCTNAPSSASDGAILDRLPEEMREVFTDRGVVRFSCAYLANKTTRSAPVEPTPLMAPAEWRRPVIIIEAHSAEEHWRAEREIIKSGRQPVLAALSQLQEAEGSIYAPLLSGA